VAFTERRYTPLDVIELQVLADLVVAASQSRAFGGLLTALREVFGIRCTKQSVMTGR
jgi:hypothetical protein